MTDSLKSDFRLTFKVVEFAHIGAFLGKILSAALIALGLAGCLDVAAAVNPASTAPQIDYQKLINDADNDTYQPVLPDDFHESQSGAPGQVGSQELSPPDAAAPASLTPVPDDAPLPPDPGEPRRVQQAQRPAQRTVVYVYHTTGCPHCRQQQRDESALPEIDFQHRPAPAWVTRFPTLHWQDPTSPTGWRQQRGWYGPEKFRRLVHQSTQQSAQAAADDDIEAAPEYGFTYAGTASMTLGPASQQGGPAPTYYGSWASREWSWEGDLREHAVSSHGLSRAEANRMTAGELAAWHTRQHEKRGRRTRGVMGDAWVWAFGGSR